MVGERGLMVTTAHVVESISAHELVIGLPNDIIAPATIVRIDTLIDLALLHAETDQVLASIDNAPSSPGIGEPVTALLIGNKAQRRVEVGAVVGFVGSMPDPAGRKIITSLRVEPGASGSPVVDKEGRLVGLVQSVDPARRMTFLISANDVFGFVGRQDETARVQNS